MPRIPQRFLLPVTLAHLLVVSQAGCIALNIPSQRLHDPGDQGGIAGPWHVKDGNADLPHHDVSLDGETACNSVCHCASEDGWSHETEPEIPWPRFHPVPTRPIFGSSLRP